MGDPGPAEIIILNLPPVCGAGVAVVAATADVTLAVVEVVVIGFSVVPGFSDVEQDAANNPISGRIIMMITNNFFIDPSCFYFPGLF
jgi:hypothetical protein